MMKAALSSLDVYVLARELSGGLQSSRVDKVYQISEREIKIKLRPPGEGAAELVLAPNYFCLTSYFREAPEQPSSFAMQLRKHLKGAFLRGIRQHGLDRIVEFEFESADGRYILVAEFFSKGNVVLCDQEKKIRGLLEWQKWKDRVLGVGQSYDYPPGGRDPFGAGLEYLTATLKSSEKGLISALATDFGLGGVYAEEACMRAGLEKERRASELGEAEVKSLFERIQEILGLFREMQLKPAIILDGEGKYLDVVPVHLRVYEHMNRKDFGSFNDAVDAYFSESSFAEGKAAGEEKLEKELEKLRRMEENQRNTVEGLELKAEEYRLAGDLIYQNMDSLEAIVKAFTEEKNGGASWEEIKKKACGRRFDGILIEDVGSDGTITLEVEE